VLHYEAMKEDIESKLVETAAFLGVPLNETKKAMILEEIDIKTMKAKQDNIASILIRKGVTKDWENAPLSAEEWAEFDKVYSETVGKREIGAPFEPYITPSPKE
jgi:kynurenine formamidase